MSFLKRSFEQSEEGYPKKSQQDAGIPPSKVAKLSMPPPTIPASRLPKPKRLSNRRSVNFHIRYCAIVVLVVA